MYVSYKMFWEFKVSSSCVEAPLPIHKDTTETALTRQLNDEAIISNNQVMTGL